MNKNKFLIQELISDSDALFGVKSSQAKPAAIKFVNNGHMPKDDHIVNHGIMDSYVIDMLLKYHLLNKAQILERA